MDAEYDKKLLAIIDERDRLRKGVQDFLDGNYSNPRSYRHDTGACPHGQPYYQDCGECNDEHFRKLLPNAS